MEHKEELLTPEEGNKNENGKSTNRHYRHLSFFLEEGKLPNLLQSIVSTFDKRDQEMIFLTLTTCISAILPKLFSIYSNNKIYSNFYLYIVGKAGSGKGNAICGRKLIAEFEKQLATFSQSGSTLLNQMMETSAEHQQMVTQSRVITPGNITSAGFLELLNEQKSNALMFETEGDTIVNIQKNEHGNYSDMMRKAFHHEPITSYRKTDKVRIEVIEPKLSIVISSTENQLKSLITSSENGLLSRFVFCFTEPTENFMNVFENKGKDRDQAISQLAITLCKLHSTLNNMDGVEFSLTDTQKVEFLQLFDENKSVLTQLFNENLDASVNRMGLVCVRMCMVVTALRYNEHDNIPSYIECCDDDFEMVMGVCNTLLYNAEKVIKMLPKQANSSEKYEAERLAIYQQLPKEFTTKEMKKCAEQYRIPERTVERFLDSKLFEKIERGRYRKL
jgi:hypothetical protein